MRMMNVHVVIIIIIFIIFIIIIIIIVVITILIMLKSGLWVKGTFKCLMLCSELYYNWSQWVNSVLAECNEYLLHGLSGQPQNEGTTQLLCLLCWMCRWKSCYGASVR